MRKTLAALLASLPLAALAQDAGQPPQGQWQYTPPPQQAPAPAPAPAAQPPQYAPPPQYTPPPPPPGQPQQYPPPQYAPPPAAPPMAPPPRPYRRDSWYIGFGVYGGDGQITDAAGTSSLKDFFGTSPTTIAVNFKIGATLTPKLLLGLDVLSLASAASSNGASASVNIANYDAMATFFPMERGFFLRGGVGLSRFSLTVSGTGNDGTSSYSGANLDLGLGYAWWIGKSFNLTANLDWSGQSWGDNNGGTTGPVPRLSPACRAAAPGAPRPRSGSGRRPRRSRRARRGSPPTRRCAG